MGSATTSVPTNSNNNAFMENLRQLFAECDLDGSGCLVKKEFDELCKKIGLSSEVAEETFKRLDIDKNGQITFDEFAAGFNQYKQTASATGQTPTPTRQRSTSTKTCNNKQAAPSSIVSDDSQTRSSPSQSPSSSFRSVRSANQSQLQHQHQQQAQQQHKLTPSPVTARARSRASPSGSGSGSGAASISLNSTGINGIGGSSSNLTASGRSTSSGGTHFDLSSSYDLNSSYELPLQQSASANDLLLNSNLTNHQHITPDQHQDDVIVYSSDLINNNNNSGSNNSGQFGSMLSNSSGYSQVKTMQDLLDCVQKLQNENQILTQIFFKDKREREEYISQLGEEFDHQLREVEERANKRAREELENEKKRLRDMMQAERETLEHHYQTLEKINKMVKSPQGQGGTKLEADEGFFKVKSQLEDTFNENRQLKKSLLDTKTDVALIWKEMEKLKKQYEMKLSSAYEKQRETKHECDHIKKQLNLMQDSNRKLQDASDVITNYIADKVEPVIKVALDGAGDEISPINGINSLRIPNGSTSNSRRGSILSEYLNNNNDHSVDTNSDRASSSAGDLESMASSMSGRQPQDSSISKSINNESLAQDRSGKKDEESKNQAANKFPTRLEVPQGVQSKLAVGGDLKFSKSAGELKQQSPSQLETSEKSDDITTEVLKGHQETIQSAKSNLRSLGRHFLLGNRSTSETKTLTNQEADKSKLTEIKSDSLDQTQDKMPNVEPADGPSVATFNIILVGDSFVGKSSFAARFIEGSFVQGLISNCSIDFKTKSYKVDGVNYTVNLWDTAGQERFRSITASYFRKADGIILMYDVTDKRSYLNVRNWMSTISDTAAENVAVLLVGNKIDLRQNENKTKCVPTDEGLRLAREYDIVFLETSVKTGTNLLPSMGQLIRLIAKNNTSVDVDNDRIRLSDKSRTFNCMPKNC